MVEEIEPGKPDLNVLFLAEFEVLGHRHVPFEEDRTGDIRKVPPAFGSLSGNSETVAIDILMSTLVQPHARIALDGWLDGVVSRAKPGGGVDRHTRRSRAVAAEVVGGAPRLKLVP